MIHSACCELVNSIRGSSLNYEITETPYSIFATIRKSLNKNEENSLKAKMLTVDEPEKIRSEKTAENLELSALRTKNKKLQEEIDSESEAVRRLEDERVIWLKNSKIVDGKIAKSEEGALEAYARLGESLKSVEYLKAENTKLESQLDSSVSEKEEINRLKSENRKIEKKLEKKNDEMKQRLDKKETEISALKVSLSNSGSEKAKAERESKESQRKIKEMAKESFSQHNIIEKLEDKAKALKESNDSLKAGTKKLEKKLTQKAKQELKENNDKKLKEETTKFLEYSKSNPKPTVDSVTSRDACSESPPNPEKQAEAIKDAQHFESAAEPDKVVQNTKSEETSPDGDVQKENEKTEPGEAKPKDTKESKSSSEPYNANADVMKLKKLMLDMMNDIKQHNS
eukprot:GFUD01030479.1.p1 GENE.GFUD01030479.1~~GFUD01030479.1.p1  ORF type:complete len:399 (+),score=122.85 GFUD01030479.1:207-1403(+)